jgi:D-xylose transport system substrate-binding protein
MKVRVALVILSLVLSVLIGLALSRGGGGVGEAPRGSRGAVARPPLVGFSMDTLKEARWQKDRDLFVRRVEDRGGEVLVQSANSDDTRQIQDVKSLITAGVDVLVVIPHDGAAMAEAVRLAHEAGIPVVAYDRIITDCDLDLYVSFDNVRVGEMQARWLVDRLPASGRSRIVRVYGAPTDNNARLFKRGQDNVLGPEIERGRIEVIHEDWAEDWSPANAKRIVNAAITRHGTDFAAILASNDGTAGGAIQALKEAGGVGSILVTGQDADLVACQRIAAGTQSMTIYKPIRALAERAAEIALDVARGRFVVADGVVSNGAKEVPSVLLEVIAVDRDNLRETVVADGFHPAESVFGTVGKGE